MVKSQGNNREQSARPKPNADAFKLSKIDDDRGCDVIILDESQLNPKL